MSHSSASAAIVDGKFKQAAAVGLRRQRHSYRRIGELLGISVCHAHRLVKQALKELNTKLREDAEEMRRLEALELDKLQAAFSHAAEAGDGKAADRILRIQQRRAALFGLDLAEKPTAAVTGNIILNVSELVINKTEKLPDGSGGTNIIIDSQPAPSPSRLPA
jgi:hypothetical protein